MNYESNIRFLDIFGYNWILLKYPKSLQLTINVFPIHHIPKCLNKFWSAVLVFYWHFPPRQVRIDGKVVKLSRQEAETDWIARRRENQAASAAFSQSSIIQGREQLKEKVHQVKRRCRGRPIPCPDSWGGYCLIPEEFEFWEGRLDWLHKRERYILNKGTWQRQVLAP